ncbi:MAG: hypothetical protein GXO32_04530 [Crenarchaeota archaeon]|nr:hypothetical protein [Thermoproteota archaeon]
MCTPLAKTSIYTIEHGDPLRYIEVYVDEHLRCIVLDLGARTLLSIDVYPESVKRSPSEIPRERCIAMESDGVELCDVQLAKSLSELSRVLGIDVQHASALFLCYRNACSEIQLRLWIPHRTTAVLEKICSEDVAELGYRGVEP